jgi:hypothetical protein
MECRERSGPGYDERKSQTEACNLQNLCLPEWGNNLAGLECHWDRNSLWYAQNKVAGLDVQAPPSEVTTSWLSERLERDLHTILKFAPGMNGVCLPEAAIRAGVKSGHDIVSRGAGCGR